MSAAIDGERRGFVAFAFDYRGSAYPDLPNTTRAAAELAAALVPRARRFLGPDELPPISSAAAVAEALESWLDDDSRGEDVLIVYLGGHGLPENGVHYLLGPSSPRSRLSSRKAISACDLATVVANCRAERVLLLIESCYSGEALGDLAQNIHDALAERRPPRLGVVPATSALETGNDGQLAEALREAITTPSNDFWTEKDECLPWDGFCEWLERRLGVRPLSYGSMWSVIPHVAHRRTADVDVEAKRQWPDQSWFELAASGVEVGEAGWFFTGRVRLLAEVRSWLGGDGHGVFALTGPPGAGKSAVIGYLALGAGGRPDVAPGPVGAAIYVKGKVLEQVVDELAGALGVAGTDVDGVLAAASAKGGLVVLVDALDEAAGYQAVAIADLLRRLGEQPGVRVLVGTRRNLAREPVPGGGSVGRIIEALAPAVVCDLGDEADVVADIAAYLERRLMVAPSPYAGHPADAARVAQVAASRVRPVFLYARLMARTLRQADAVIENAPGWEDRLPDLANAEGFAGLMGADLARYGPDEGRIRALLAGLAWGEGSGLPRYRVWPAVARAVSGRAVDDEDVRAALDLAGWYVVESAEDGQTVYRLYHEELVRFFRQETRRGH